jgi:hypothetical protein
MEPVSLYFTSSHSANFTNSDGQGTLTFSENAATAPLSLEGKTIIGKSAGSGSDSFHYGMFTNDGGSGTYTYAIYGPRVAMVIEYNSDNTNAPHYTTLWFSSATGGSYRSDNGSGNIKIGTFTMK